MLVKCYAKLNLFLDIANKRGDGFHDLRSVFQSISLFDIIKVKLSDEFSLSFSGDTKFSQFLKEEKVEANLLYSIYLYFRENFSIKPIQVLLEKNIPIGAGLGGGSSDAAGYILALNHLFSLGLSQKKLQEIGLLFGSDVPFFIKGGCQDVQGRGEILSRLSSDSLFYFVLVYPEEHISTKEAYLENLTNNLFFDEAEKKFEGFKNALKRGDFSSLCQLKINSFEDLTIKRYPSVKRVFDQLNVFSKYTMLSGSGASVFALFKTKKEAEKCFQVINKQNKYVYFVQSTQLGSEILF